MDLFVSRRDGDSSSNKGCPVLEVRWGLALSFSHISFSPFKCNPSAHGRFRLGAPPNMGSGRRRGGDLSLCPRQALSLMYNIIVNVCSARGLALRMKGAAVYGVSEGEGRENFSLYF